jgi:hypothetical protein
MQESAYTNCDKFLTVLAPNPDCRAKSTKNLGTAYSYNLENGILSGQQDMTLDQCLVPPSLPKGFSINSSGVLYGPNEHKFWTVTYNRFDEFEGVPGLETGSCIKARLCKSKGLTQEPEVIEQLLEHASALSLKSELVLSSKCIDYLLSSMKTFMEQKKIEKTLMALTILTSSSLESGGNSTEIINVLDKILEEVNCDQQVIEDVINLRLNICTTDPFLTQINQLMQKNLRKQAASFLRQLYIKRTLENILLHQLVNLSMEWICCTNIKP